MNQKGFALIIIVIVIGIVGLAGGLGARYFLEMRKPAPAPLEKPPAATIQEAAPATTNTIASNTIQNMPSASTPVSSVPSLSADKKSIVADGKVLLTVSQLCDGYNLTSTPDRPMFCENKISFKNKARFDSIVASPDKMKIGFTIVIDPLSPEAGVAGIFVRSTNKINFLTDYYIGNEFISFSPGGANFVYQAGCFEAMCGLYIENSETFARKTILSDSSEYADTRTRNATFVRWISDNEVEYRLGTELKRESF